MPDTWIDPKTEILWYDYNEEEAVGRIGVRRDSYGLGLYVPDPTEVEGARRLCWVDLFHASPMRDEDDEPPFVQLIVCPNPDIDDPLLHVRYLHDRTEVLDGQANARPLLVHRPNDNA